MSAPIPKFRQVKTFKVHKDSVNSLVFSPDGNFLASGGADGLLFIFRTKDWNEIRRYKVDFAIRALFWNLPQEAASSFVARVLGHVPGIVSFGGDDGTLNASNTLVPTEYKVSGPIQCLAIEKEGKLLAVGYMNKVEVARRASASWIRDRNITIPSASPNDRVLSVTFRDQKCLVITYLHGRVLAYKLTQSVTLLWKLDIGGLAGASALSTNSRFLATTGMFQGIVVHDINEQQRRANTIQPAGDIDNLNIPLPIIFLENMSFAVGSQDGRVAVYKTSQSGVVQILKHESDNAIQALGYFHRKENTKHFLATGMANVYEDCILTIWLAEDNPRSMVPWRWAISILGLATLTALGFQNRQRLQTSLPSRRRWKELTWNILGQNASEVLEHDRDKVVTTVVTQTVSVTRSILPVGTDPASASPSDSAIPRTLVKLVDMN
ncbi:WD40-repeat-containing domain protein [Mycena alexandri]|uniref:WD40-repeat-containing domain protein n=1 Tax=Mycena alexandri TaxID=1745969 RepID=A0AAD6S4F6_9AGAR|nr:WD40-repeat-containing domain protein [Mycena alexandri]